MTEPAQEEMSPAMPEAVEKTNGTKKMRQALPAPTGIGPFFSEWYLVPGAAFALMPLPNQRPPEAIRYLLGIV